MIQILAYRPTVYKTGTCTKILISKLSDLLHAQFGQSFYEVTLEAFFLFSQFLEYVVNNHCVMTDDTHCAQFKPNECHFIKVS